MDPKQRRNKHGVESGLHEERQHQRDSRCGYRTRAETTHRSNEETLGLHQEEQAPEPRKEERNRGG